MVALKAISICLIIGVALEYLDKLIDFVNKREDKNNEIR